MTRPNHSKERVVVLPSLKLQTFANACVMRKGILLSANVLQMKTALRRKKDITSTLTPITRLFTNLMQENYFWIKHM